MRPSEAADTPCPSPAYPIPEYDYYASYMTEAMLEVERRIDEILNTDKAADQSLAVEVTTSSKTVFTLYRTARDVNPKRPGAKQVDGDTVFRMASITKVFTVLALLQQQAAGNLSLDDPISKHIEELQGAQRPGYLQFDRITLRSLASQLSGIPRNVAMYEITEGPDAVVGLAPRPGPFPRCGDASAGDPPCSCTDLINSVKVQRPLFAPNERSTYSNQGFDLLGLVLARKTGQRYEDHMKLAVFEGLGMHDSSFERPDDSRSAIPEGHSDWDTDYGIENADGGMFSTSSDLSIFLRFVLTHANDITPALNWLNPVSFSGGAETSYGMPWEITRTMRKAEPGTNSPVTYVAKAGEIQGYDTLITVIPDLGLGLTILQSGGDGYNESVMSKLRGFIMMTIAAAGEKSAAAYAKAKYAGTYVSTDPEQKSSIEIAVEPSTGMTVTSYKYGETDLLGALKLEPYSRLALTPVGQPAGSGGHKFLATSSEPPQDGLMALPCDAELDASGYGGVQINQFIFWVGAGKGDATELELPAFPVRLRRKEG